MSTPIRGYIDPSAIKFPNRIDPSGLRPGSISIGNGTTPPAKPRTYESQALLHSPAAGEPNEAEFSFLSAEAKGASPFSNVASITSKRTKPNKSTLKRAEDALNAMACEASGLKRAGLLTAEGQRAVVELIQGIKKAQQITGSEGNPNSVIEDLESLRTKMDQAILTPEATALARKLTLALAEATSSTAPAA